MPRKPVGNRFLERVARCEQGLFPRRGIVHEPPKGADDKLWLCYEHPEGEIHAGDALAWLDAQPAGSMALIIADPPYGLGREDWDRFESCRAYLEWSAAWIAAAARALGDEGSLYICGFSEILADLKAVAMAHFKGCRWLVWSYRNKAQLARNSWGRSHESLLYLWRGTSPTFNVDAVRVPYGDHTLRYPERRQASSSVFARGAERTETWQPHPDGARPRDVLDVPTLTNGMPEKTPHPTQKPEALLRRLILASSSPGDVVGDPFVGSGTTLVAASQLGRRWRGVEREHEYLRWAITRLEEVDATTPEDWLARDLEEATRRQSIRGRGRRSQAP